MRATRALFAAVLVVIAAGASGRGQDRSEAVLASIDANRDRYAEIARQIWDFAEVGYRETKSCALLQQHLRAAGFTVESGIAAVMATTSGRASASLMSASVKAAV